MRTIYVTAQSAQLPAPENQLTAHNIKVSSFVTIGKNLTKQDLTNQQQHYNSDFCKVA
jgi:hypothetical protein